MALTKKITAISLLLAFPVFNLFAQLSPGDLTEAHAHLEGMSNCTKCHILGEKVSNEKCLECHTELKVRVEQNKGYHASSEIRGKECVSCHSEHHGRKFEMIRFDRDNFSHNLTGYELQGAHMDQKCEACHKKDHIKDPELRKKTYTYLGLDTECLTCHEDQHQGTLGSSCLNCHDFQKFKPASRFDHNNTDYPLRGKHLDVKCDECHQVTEKNGTEFRQYSGIAHNNCNACHKDVHNNNFGQDCRKCHTEESFTIIRGLNEFDHSRTGFELGGKHAFVDCAKCHKTSRYTDPLKHDRCDDCHEDYHDGQFIRNDRKSDCASCHSTEGFNMSSFTIERHNEGAFRLEGAHLATPCYACHKKEDKWDFRYIGKVCSDCHENIHKDFISEKYYDGAGCTNCHSVNMWSEISFDHSRTKFELEGQHRKQDCRACHFKDSAEGKALQRFKGLGTDCTSCHQDRHYNQFEEDGITDCRRCHGAESWNIPDFNHDRTRFPLDGKHRNVACEKCHKEVIEKNVKYIQYKFESIACETCH